MVFVIGLDSDRNLTLFLMYQHILENLIRTAIKIS